MRRCKKSACDERGGARLRVHSQFKRRRDYLSSPAAVFQSDRDESVGGASGRSFPRTIAAASLAGGSQLDRCNRRVQRRRPDDEPVCNRADPDHDERDDSRWLWALALAVFDGRHEINCIEYPLSEDEALQFILTHHQTRCGWNAFVRIRLALNRSEEHTSE